MHEGVSPKLKGEFELEFPKNYIGAVRFVAVGLILSTSSAFILHHLSFDGSAAQGMPYHTVSYFYVFTVAN